MYDYYINYQPVKGKTLIYDVSGYICVAEGFFVIENLAFTSPKGKDYTLTGKHFNQWVLYNQEGVTKRVIEELNLNPNWTGETDI